MKIGFGRGDITPRGGKVSLCGQYHLRVTETVLDPLMAYAMVIESEDERTVFVAADTLQPYAFWTTYLCEALQTVLPGLKEDQLIISATHIHTGPGPRLKMTGEELEPDGVISLESCFRIAMDGAIEAVRQALVSLTEARLEFGISRIQTGMQRMTVFSNGQAEMYGDIHRSDFRCMFGRDGGPVYILYAYRTGSDELIGIVADVPCPAQCDEMAEVITADYWGVVREKIWAEFGPNTGILPLCRAAGDLSPHDLIDVMPAERDYGLFAGRQIAEKLGERIFRGILETRHRTVCGIDSDVGYIHRMHVIDLPMWRVSDSEYDWAREILRAYPHEENRTTALAEAFIKRYLQSDPAVCHARVHTVLTGTIMVMTFPFELYAAYADRIRLSLPMVNLLDVQLCYENLGYLPTEEAASRGWNSYSANLLDGACGPEGGDELVKACIEIGQQMRGSVNAKKYI